MKHYPAVWQARLVAGQRVNAVAADEGGVGSDRLDHHHPRQQPVERFHMDEGPAGVIADLRQIALGKPGPRGGSRWASRR